MDVEKRLNLIKEVGEEIITEQELKKLLEEKKEFIAYDGFEPSGRMHIAQGIMRVVNINKMIKAGCKFKMLIADWHAWANNKFNGDLEKIRICGDYFKEVWKALGLSKKVEYIYASELVRDDKYWGIVMQVARNSSLKRIIRCGQIMGRSEKETLQASQIFYPCMQAADIFYLKVDIAQLGMDQRKVNVLARELAEKLGYKKPIAVHHHMLIGLGKPPQEKSGVERAISLKMSKSKPDTAIFMDDSKEEIERKITKAYCPEGITEENPILEYCKYIIFEKFKTMKIERPEKFGGNIEFKSYKELEEVYKKKELHPLDLKKAVAFYLNELIEPVRKYFKENKKARELLEKVRSFKVER